MRRRAAALALLAPLLLGPAVAAAPASPASAQDATATPTATPTPPPTAGPEPEAPVDVQVSTLAPRAPRAGDPLRVSGRLVNTGSAPVSRLRVRLRVGRVLISRSALEEADLEGAATRRVQDVGVLLDQGPLAPGGARPFDLRTEVDRLRLSADGVYPLQVEVQGAVGDGPGGELLGLASTFVPWFEEQPVGTTRIAWLWPLVAPPSAAPRATRRGPLLLDDDLAGELAPRGRLARLLRAARDAEPVPVTYAVDPDLLQTVQGMSGGYDVRLSPSRVRPGDGAEDARTWLDELRAAVAPGPDGTAATSSLLALPYADLDVASLAGSVLAEDVDLAVDDGLRTAQRVAGAEPVRGLAWAPPGPVPVQALGAYRLAGAGTLVVSEDALPPRAATEPRTASAVTSLQTATGRLGGLVVDEGLSRLLRAPDGDDRWQGARLAEQRWLVESAMISAERPDDTRTLLVALPRDAEVVPAVVAQALRDSAGLPWLCPVALPQVADGGETCPEQPGSGSAAVGSAQEDRGVPLAPPLDAPRLTPEQLERVAEGRRAIDQLTLEVLAQSDEAADTRRRLLRGAFRAASTAWRDDPRRGRTFAALLGDDVDDLAGRVAVLTGPVTLTSTRGSLDLTVENTLDQAVAVRVRLSAPNAARLDTEVTDVQEVPARTSVQVRVRAEPRTSGQFPVEAQLLDRDGEPFGPSATFVVRSTRYGAVALAVTGVGAGVLLLAVGVRIVRRALGADTGSFGRRRRAAAEPPR